MNKNLCLIVFLALIELGTALNCYQCDKCSNTKTDWRIVQACGRSITDRTLKGACLKQVTGNATSQVVSRNCATASFRNGKLEYNCTVEDRQNLLKCIVCDKDLCNAAASVNLQLGFGLVVGVGALYLFHQFL